MQVLLLVAAIVDVENGIEKTTSGPAVRFTVNPEAADRAGFTTEELGTVAVSMVDGEPATHEAGEHGEPDRGGEQRRADLEA